MVFVPLPAVAPVKFPVGAFQLYVVPDGTTSVPLTGAMTKVPPLQMVAVLFAIEGVMGCALRVTLVMADVQVPEVTDIE